MDWEGRRFTIRVLIVCCGQAHWDGKLNLSYIRVKPLDWGGRRFTIRVLIICYGYGQAHWDGKLNLSRSSTLFQIGYNAHGCPHQRILEERKTFTIRALIICYLWPGVQAYWDGKLNLSGSSTLFQIEYNTHGGPKPVILVLNHYSKIGNKTPQECHYCCGRQRQLNCGRSLQITTHFIYHSNPWIGGLSISRNPGGIFIPHIVRRGT